MYIKRTVVMRNTIDIEKVYVTRYGRGEAREKRRQPTPEEIERNNARVAAKKLKWILNTNFGPGDYHATLTYRPEERPDKKEARKQLKSLLGKLKRAYKKRGMEFKYIAVTEYKRKSIHHHIVLNGFSGEEDNTVRLIGRLWKCGRPKFVPMDENGEYGQLADYLIKETEKTFRDKEAPGKQRYSRSRNLKMPEIKVEEMKAKEWRKEPKPPKGYYIDKNSFYDGINGFTGRRCQYYTCVRIQGVKKE